MENETVVEPKSTEETVLETESVEEIDWEARAKKAEELAQNQKIRAEKAEKLAKNSKVDTKVETKEVGTLNSKDLLALMNAKVSEEDVSDVEDYAKFKGISLTEALKSSTVKNILAEKEEARKVALATNTGNARRVTKKVTGDDLLDEAAKGNMPDDVDALAKARIERKKKR